MRIVHVTETLVAGVLTAVAALAGRQRELGHDVTVVYPRKPTVPPPDELDRTFDPGVRRIEVRYRGRARVVPLLARVISDVCADDTDVVHLHSTFAGVAGRIVPGLGRRVGVIAYSPHGWAFLRGDGGAFSNAAALAVERALAHRCTGLVLVSESEAAVTREHLDVRAVHVLTNGIATENLPHGAGSGQARPVVAMSGRIMEQKAPDRFADAARDLAERADFVWIGDGTPQERSTWVGSAPVEITGWLPRNEVIDRLAAADVFLFPTRWEGMPISLMEAQAIGLPAVATDIVGNRDVVLDGQTGMLCAPAELIAATARLIGDPDLRQRMRDHALSVQRVRLSDSTLGSRSIAVYTDLAAGRETSARHDQ